MTTELLSVLIATIDNRILGVRHLLRPLDKRVQYVVSHQVTRGLGLDSQVLVKELAARQDVKYSVVRGKGVAKNRNNLLRHIRPSSISLILDDDVRLCDRAYEKVLSAFQANPEADFISFKILGLQGQDFKTYPTRLQKHTLVTLAGIGTTEIAFRNDFVLKKNITFDERFGVGSDVYPIGEDFVFAVDLYRSGAKMLFVPVPIAIHPPGSTGSKTDARAIFARGAVFGRVFGVGAFAVNLLFGAKKRASYCADHSFFSYWRLLHQGTMDYLTRANPK